MANHATIVRATPVLIADLHKNSMGSHCPECNADGEACLNVVWPTCRPNNKYASHLH